MAALELRCILWWENNRWAGGGYGPRAIDPEPEVTKAQF
jgi:hypothetical protein